MRGCRLVEECTGTRVASGQLRPTFNTTDLFGTDGAFSAVRSRLTRTDRFDFEQRYLEHGYKEVAMQPDALGAFKMQKERVAHLASRRVHAHGLAQSRRHLYVHLVCALRRSQWLGPTRGPRGRLGLFREKLPRRRAFDSGPRRRNGPPIPRAHWS